MWNLSFLEATLAKLKYESQKLESEKLSQFFELQKVLVHLKLVAKSESWKAKTILNNLFICINMTKHHFCPQTFWEFICLTLGLKQGLRSVKWRKQVSLVFTTYRSFNVKWDKFCASLSQTVSEADFVFKSQYGTKLQLFPKQRILNYVFLVKLINGFVETFSQQFMKDNHLTTNFA